MSEPFLSVFPSFVGFVSVFCFDTLHVAHHVDRFFRASSFVSLDHSTPRRLFFHLFFFSSGWYATPSTSDPSVPSFRRIDPRTTRSVSSNPTLLPASCAMSRGDPRACNPVGGGPSSPSSSSRPSPGSNARPPHTLEREETLLGDGEEGRVSLDSAATGPSAWTTWTTRARVEGERTSGWRDGRRHGGGGVVRTGRCMHANVDRCVRSARGRSTRQSSARPPARYARVRFVPSMCAWGWETHPFHVGTVYRARHVPCASHPRTCPWCRVGRGSVPYYAKDGAGGRFRPRTCLVFHSFPRVASRACPSEVCAS